MAAVAGVYHGNSEVSRRKLRRAGRSVAHHDAVGLQRLEREQRVLGDSSPFATDDCATAMLIASALMILAAISKEVRVRIKFS